MYSLLDKLIDNRYKVFEKINEGGMAEVYKVHDLETQEIVAVKFMKEKVTSAYVEDLIRFKKEIEVISKLEHLNIVKILASGEYENIPYIVMEMLEGESLADLLKSARTFSIDQSVEIIRQLIIALNYVHNLGIIHRDLKPGNVMLIENDDKIKVKLLDFGLALVMKLSGIEGAEEIVGTFGYMSPEATGILNKKLDDRSDLYSLGIILYHLLTGQLPFTAKEVDKLLHQQVTFNPISPSEINKNIPSILEDIVIKLIQKDPDLRYQSATGLLYDIERYQNGEREFIVGEKDQKIKLTYQTRLIGREEEFARVKGLINKTREGQGSICLIGGEAGVGKSRLIEELRAYVYELGGLFISGRCFNQTNKIPYQPFRDAINVYINNLEKLDKVERENTVARLKSLVGDLGEILVKLNYRMAELLGEVNELSPLEPERDNKRFLMVLSDFFCHLVDESKICVLFLDDLHWADVGSFSLLEEILQKINSSNLLVLGTYRDNEVGKEHGVEKLKALSKERDLSLKEIKITLFDSQKLNKLVARLLGEKEERCNELTQYVLEKSKGNPFFAIEIVRQMVDEKVLIYDELHWKPDWERIRSITISPSIIDIIIRRIDALQEDQLTLLYYGAVIGREFEIELLMHLINLPKEKVISLIDETITLQLLEWSSTRGQVIFVHDRVRDAFNKRMSASDKIKLHHEVAMKLEEMYKENLESVIFDLVHHFIESGDKKKSLEYLLPAAEKARASYANEEAIRYYNIEIKLLEENQQNENPQWIRAKEGLIQVYLTTGRNDEVIQIAQEILPLKDVILEKTEIYHQIGNAYFKKGDFKNCEDTLAIGLDMLGEFLPRKKGDVILSIIAELLVHMVHCLFPNYYWSKRSKPVKPEILEISAYHVVLDWMYVYCDLQKYCLSVLMTINLIERKLGESRELGKCMCAYGGLCSAIPLFSRGIKYHEKSIAIMKKLEDPRNLEDQWWRARAIVIMCFGYAWGGQYKKSLYFLQECKEIFQRIGDLWELGIVCNCLGYCNYYLCNYSLTQEFFSQFFDISFKINDIHGICTSKVFSTALYVEVGEYEKAEQAGKYAEKLTEENKIWDTNCVAVVNLGYLELERSKFDTAIKYFEGAKKLFEANSFLQDYSVKLYPFLADALIENYKVQVLNTNDKYELEKIKHACKKALKATKRWPNHYGTALRAQAKYFDLIGNKKNAERFFLKSIRHNMTLGRKFELAKSYYEYGFLLKSTNKIEQARCQWQEAYSIFKDIGAEKYVERCSSLLGIANEKEQEQVKELTIQDRLNTERRMSAILTTSRYLSSILDTDQLLDRIMDKAIELIGAERGILFLYPDEGIKELEVRVLRNISKEEIESEAFDTSSNIISKVESEKEPLIISDAGTNEELKSQASVVTHGLRSVLCAPIMIRGEILGVIYLDNRLVSGLFNEEDLNILDLIANQAGVSIENARLYNKAIKDGLTGLYNRSFLDDYLMKSIYESQRIEKKICILMLDIDYFKKVNDQYGHQVGDLAIKTVSSTLMRAIRQSDIAARYGGEEFVVVLPGSDISGAVSVGEKIRKNIEDTKIVYKSKGESKEISITISIGVAKWNREEDKLQLVEKADKALYKAKQAGRNRVVVYEEE